MASSGASTVEEYLAALPGDRRGALEAVRRTILEHLPDGYREEMSFGMIGYVVPLERYPDTYNRQPLQLAALASQKNYMSLYLNCIYSDQEALERFTSAYRATGKRLDMGKSCVRFRSLDQLPLEVVAEAIASTPVERHIETYEASRAPGRASPSRTGKK
jgi:hypothetical protein